MSGPRRNLKAVYTIWYRDILRFSRDRIRIIASLGQPLLFLFVFSSGLVPAIPGLTEGAVHFRTFLFPGIVTMALLFTAVFSAISIIWDREFGFLKEVLVAPVPRYAVALGKVAGGTTVALFQGLIILILAPFLGVHLDVVQVSLVLALMLLTAAAMTSLGVLVAARMHNMETFPVVMNFIVMPMFFLSGAFFPLKNVPEWMHWLGIINPMSYGVDAIRQVVLRGNARLSIIEFTSLHTVTTDILVIIAFWMVMMIPAIYVFSRQE